MANNADNFILVRLTEKFRHAIFHEFHPDHPHQTDKGGELLVTGDRIVQAAPTPGVRAAMMGTRSAGAVLEEVRESGAVASPEPPDVLDVVNGLVQPLAAPTAPSAPSAPPSETKATSGTK